jgi:dihydroorotate dehydrogenase electron transfer subunit
LVSIHQENARTFTYTLDASIAASPGQFAMLWLPGLDEKPFSILSAAPLRFTIAAVGPFTRALARLTPGDPLWWRGPYGQGFTPAGQDHILVGGGYGVAPMLFLAKELCSRGHRVRTIIGARTATDLLLTQETRAAGAELHLTTDDGTAGLQGRVTDALAPMLQTAPPDTLYACGPHPMLEALAAACAPAGIPAQLSWEAYMRCAIGLCGSCEHQSHLLCADGPVLHHPPTLQGTPRPPAPHWPSPTRPSPSPLPAPPEPQP